MILNSQKAFREIQDVDFCYICGQQFLVGDRKNRDHVPPKAMFKVEDRNALLTLPTHEACNNSLSDEDELVGQLVAVLHGKPPGSNKLQKSLAVFRSSYSKQPLVGLKGVSLPAIIWRWIKGFHAALYRVAIKDWPGGFIHPPMPPGYLKGGRIIYECHLDDRKGLIEMIKINRRLEKLDTIWCWGGKCRYECTWTKTDEDKNICVFGLQIYNWDDLGDSHFPRLGCVGYYGPVVAVPKNAAIGTKLDVPILNLQPLNPFGA